MGSNSSSRASTATFAGAMAVAVQELCFPLSKEQLNVGCREIAQRAAPNHSTKLRIE
jgi:hypothetical protein